MPDVVMDYALCLGDGDCADACPLEALEVGEGSRWCRVSPRAVANQEADAAFSTLVDGVKEAVPVRIHFRVVGCILCYACMAACERRAIDVLEEYRVRDAVEGVKPPVPLEYVV